MESVVILNNYIQPTVTHRIDDALDTHTTVLVHTMCLYAYIQPMQACIVPACLATRVHDIVCIVFPFTRRRQVWHVPC